MTKPESTPTWQAVIVGGGAAGLSAALVLGRARRRVLLLDAGEQSNLPAHGIGGLLGHDGLPPADLYARGRAELAAYPSVTVRDVRVTAGGATSGDGFTLTTADGDAVTSRHVLLATGMGYCVPEIPGIDDLWGDTVFHCPYCHGWEARDGRLAVLGTFGAAHRALLLRGWSDDVVVLTDGPRLDDAERDQLTSAGVPIDERRVGGLRARDGRLEAVLFADGGEMARDGILAHAPLVQRSSLAADLGAASTGRGTVDVDRFTQTTVPGLYAAGDLGAMFPNVAGAIAEGAMAAAAINAGLVADEFGVEPMLPRREPVAAA